jgi:mannose-6-phosphate isomerase class I
LSRIHVRRGGVTRVAAGPEILGCVDGAVQISAGGGSPAVSLTRGAAAFVPGSSGAYVLSGEGTVFRATVGAPGLGAPSQT